MIDNNEMYVVIDENYTATVRDLKSFEAYLKGLKTLSPEFGEITYINDDADRSFINDVKEIRKQHIDRFADNSKNFQFRDKKAIVLKDQRIGKGMEVFRNQGDRDATIVSVLGEDVLIEYEMPNGSTALNIVKADGSYKSMPYSKLQRTSKWLKNLDKSLLINNPQSGKALEM